MQTNNNLSPEVPAQKEPQIGSGPLSQGASNSLTGRSPKEPIWPKDAQRSSASQLLGSEPVYSDPEATETVLDATEQTSRAQYISNGTKVPESRKHQQPQPSPLQSQEETSFVSFHTTTSSYPHPHLQPGLFLQGVHSGQSSVGPNNYSGQQGSWTPGHQVGFAPNKLPQNGNLPGNRPLSDSHFANHQKSYQATADPQAFVPSFQSGQQKMYLVHPQPAPQPPNSTQSYYGPVGPTFDHYHRTQTSHAQFYPDQTSACHGQQPDHLGYPSQGTPLQPQFNQGYQYDQNGQYNNPSYAKISPSNGFSPDSGPGTIKYFQGSSQGIGRSELLSTSLWQTGVPRQHPGSWHDPQSQPDVPNHQVLGVELSAPPSLQNIPRDNLESSFTSVHTEKPEPTQPPQLVSCPDQTGLPASAHVLPKNNGTLPLDNLGSGGLPMAKIQSHPIHSTQTGSLTKDAYADSNPSNDLQYIQNFPESPKCSLVDTPQDFDNSFDHISASEYGFVSTRQSHLPQSPSPLPSNHPRQQSSQTSYTGPLQSFQKITCDPNPVHQITPADQQPTKPHQLSPASHTNQPYIQPQGLKVMFQPPQQNHSGVFDPQQTNSQQQYHEIRPQMAQNAPFMVISQSHPEFSSQAGGVYAFQSHIHQLPQSSAQSMSHLPTAPTYYGANPNMSFVSQQSASSVPGQSQSNMMGHDLVQRKILDQLRVNPLPIKTPSFSSENVYHLIHFTQNKEQGVLTEKYLVSERELLRLSNVLSIDSQDKLLRKDNLEGFIIQFEKLKKVSARFLGTFGRLSVIVKALVENRLVDAGDSVQFENRLRHLGSGLFAVPLSFDHANLCILLVLVSTDENDFDNVSEKKNFTRLLRFLTQLCPTNIVALDKKDADRIQFDLGEKTKRHERYIPKNNQVDKNSCQLVGKKILQVDCKEISINQNSTSSIIYGAIEIAQQPVRKSQTLKFSEFKSFHHSFRDCSVKVDEEFSCSIDDLKKFLGKHDSEDSTKIIDLIHKKMEDRKSIADFEKKVEDETNTTIDAICMKSHSFTHLFGKNVLNPQINKLIPPMFVERLQKAADAGFSFDKEMETAQKIFQKLRKWKFWPSELNAMKVWLSEAVDDGDISNKNSQFLFEKFITASQKAPDRTIGETMEKIKDNFFTKFIENYNNCLEEPECSTSTKDKKIGFMMHFKSWESKKICPGDLGNFIEKKIGQHFKHETLTLDDTLEALECFEKTVEALKNHFPAVKSQIFDKIRLSKMRKQENDFLKEEFLIRIKNLFEREGNENTVFIKGLKDTSSSWPWSSNSFEITLEKYKAEEPKVRYLLKGLTVSGRDLENLASDPAQLLTPAISPVTTIQFPKKMRLLQFFSVANKMGAIFNSDGRLEIQIFNPSKPSEPPLPLKMFGNEATLSDFNEAIHKLVFLYQKDKELNLVLYTLGESLTPRQEGTIDIASRSGVSTVRCLRVAPNGEVIVLDQNYNLWSFDCKKSIGTKLKVGGASLRGAENMVFVPKSSCLLVISPQKIVPVMVGGNELLPEISLETPIDPAQVSIATFGSQTHLICKAGAKLQTLVLKCSLNNQSFVLARRDDPGQKKEGSNQTRCILDYFTSLYGNFAVYNPLEKASNQLIAQNLLVYLDRPVCTQEIMVKVHRKLAEIQRGIQKPNAQMIGLAENLLFLLPGRDHSQKLFGLCQPQTMDRWIQNLISFVPIQIARTENNVMLVMQNGQPMDIGQFNDVFELLRGISFGLMETLFRNWNKPIKVITTMGKQSTGKSYALNHLAGTTFAIAAGRCTDGCWMTVRITEDCLYVLMDFEGLGSFERSMQEDMLLSILNASMSSLTLLRTEYSMGRDMDTLFSQFNQGANLLKGSDKIFLGIFCIVIKDARLKDVDGLCEEFRDKIKHIVDREDQNNFISKMFKGGMDVYAFPPLDLPEYFIELENQVGYIQTEVPATFNNGKEFLDMLKTVLAKIAMQDYTSLSMKEGQMRIHFLGSFLDKAFRFGTLADEQTNCADYCFKSLDKQDELISPEVTFELESGGQPLNMAYADWEVTLEPDNQSLISKFKEFLPKRNDNVEEWDLGFKAFCRRAIEERTSRVRSWLSLNLQKWNDATDFQETINQFWQLVDQKVHELEERGKVCSNGCIRCHAKCVLPLVHSGDHLCEIPDQFHECDCSCTYCEENGEEAKCSLRFGHSGQHLCGEKSHTCGEPCKYKKCLGICQEMCGHESDHLCGQKTHMCPENCSLPSCKGRCFLSADHPHTVHKCVAETCPESCEVDRCHLRCSCNNHFHGYLDLTSTFIQENGADKDTLCFKDSEGNPRHLEKHCCGNSHGCPEECEKDGYCKVTMERKVVKDTFQGARDNFEYQRTFENVGVKLPCLIQLSPFEFRHEGVHMHSKDQEESHQCTTRCPTCNNICDKLVGHDGRHSTTHGNMTKCYFVSDQNEIDVGDHKYVTGERAVAEMCNMFCHSLGRGHIHIMPCGKTEAECQHDETGKIRHQRVAYGPDFEVTKDEVQHDEFWRLIDFEDPCLKSDLDIFSKCPFFCGSEEHGSDPDPRYCQLDLWHNKVKTLADVGSQNGFISSDGHYFECIHQAPNMGYHFVFCMDDSGSMSGTPWFDLQNSATDFCDSRKQSAHDRLTMVQFNESPQIMCEDLPMKSFDPKKHLVFRSGGTLFGPALTTCHQLMKKYEKNTLIPILVFMSDGGQTTEIPSSPRW